MPRDWFCLVIGKLRIEINIEESPEVRSASGDRHHAGAFTLDGDGRQGFDGILLFANFKDQHAGVNGLYLPAGIGVHQSSRILSGCPVIESSLKLNGIWLKIVVF